jgi:transposase
MTQGINDRFWQAEARTQDTRQFIRDIKRITRRKFTAEEKIRIVLEGFRRDTPIRDLCRREGIRPGTYYAWLKDFMEAGKDRLTRDITRDATRAEIQDIKRENARLKQLVAELSLQVHVLKKRQLPIWNKGEVCTGECHRKKYYSSSCS